MSYNYHYQSDIPANTPLGVGNLTFGDVQSLLAQIAEWLSAERLYRCRIMYDSPAGVWQNTLYYWASSFGADWIADAESIAFQISQEIVPAIASVIPPIIRVAEVRVSGFNKFFDQISDEYIKYVNVGGSAGTGDAWKTGRPAWNMRMFLNPGGFVQSVGQSVRLLPRRGRIYVPANISSVAPGESVDTGWFSVNGPLGGLGNKLSQPLENANPPVVYKPIRVKFARIPVVNRFIATGYLPVIHCVPSPEVSFLDKRQY